MIHLKWGQLGSPGTGGERCGLARSFDDLDQADYALLDDEQTAFGTFGQPAAHIGATGLAAIVGGELLIKGLDKTIARAVVARLIAAVESTEKQRRAGQNTAQLLLAAGYTAAKGTTGASQHGGNRAEIMIAHGDQHGLGSMKALGIDGAGRLDPFGDQGALTSARDRHGLDLCSPADAGARRGAAAKGTRLLAGLLGIAFDDALGQPRGVGLLDEYDDTASPSRRPSGARRSHPAAHGRCAPASRSRAR